MLGIQDRLLLSILQTFGKIYPRAVSPTVNKKLNININTKIWRTLLTGRLQLAHVTERQSGQIKRFCLGFAINPDEHY